MRFARHHHFIWQMSLLNAFVSLIALATIQWVSASVTYFLVLVTFLPTAAFLLYAMDLSNHCRQYAQYISWQRGRFINKHLYVVGLCIAYIPLAYYAAIAGFYGNCLPPIFALFALLGTTFPRQCAANPFSANMSTLSTEQLKDLKQLELGLPVRVADVK